MGTSLASDGLSALPAVKNNLKSLGAVLTDPDLVGMRSESVTILSNPRNVDTVLSNLDQLTKQEHEVLIFYFSGHGLVDQDTGELLLSLPGTNMQNMSWRGLKVVDVRKLLHRAPASTRILIVDSCFSGRALDVMSPPNNLLTGGLDVEGVVTIASAPPNTPALAPRGETHTAFTGALLNQMRSGHENSEQYLDLETLFGLVKAELRRKSRPLPLMLNTNNAHHLPFVRNSGWRIETSQTVTDSSGPGSLAVTAEQIRLGENPSTADPHSSFPLIDNSTVRRNNTRYMLPPLDQAAIPGLEAKVRAFTEKIATVHQYDIEHEKLLTDIQTMGDDETRRVREGCARLQTDEPFTKALSEIRTGGDPLSGLQPTWLDRIGTRYVERLRTYGSHIDAVIGSLLDIQDELGKGAAAIRLNGLMIQESMLRIRQYLFVAERLESELSEIAARADSQASEIDDGASSAASAARQRYEELEEQMTVADATYRVVRSVDADNRELNKHFDSAVYGLRNLKIAASGGDVEGIKATLIESSAILSSLQADLSELSSRIRRIRRGSSKFSM